MMSKHVMVMFGDFDYDQDEYDDNDDDDDDDDDGDDDDDDDASPWLETSSWWQAGTERLCP